MQQTPLCRQVGIDYPIFSVGVAPGLDQKLAAAVSNAGACGVVGFNRVGGNIRDRLVKVLDGALQPGILGRVGARICVGTTKPRYSG